MFKRRSIRGESQKKVETLRAAVDDSSYELTPVVLKRRKLHTCQDAQDQKKEENEDRQCAKTVLDGDSNLDIKSYLTISNDESMEGLTGRNGMKSCVEGIETRVLMDYQPDVCKDFKQTGYCGYGDNCKFLHSRDDFRAGWELNQEWKMENIKVEKELNEIPFKCLICKGSYKRPVVTKCEHYFCSGCFMERAKTTTKCFVCDKDTYGSVKMASKLKKVVGDIGRM